MAARDPERPPDDRVLKSLEFLVQGEGHRVLSETQLAPDPARIAAGWERRFIADSQRAAEAKALYEELGFEVACDPVRPETFGEDCDDCLLRSLLHFKTIYTRKRRGDES